MPPSWSARPWACWSPSTGPARSSTCGRAPSITCRSWPAPWPWPSSGGGRNGVTKRTVPAKIGHDQPTPDPDLGVVGRGDLDGLPGPVRSEEHTSELQSHVNLVCRLLLEKKKKDIIAHPRSI